MASRSFCSASAESDVRSTWPPYGFSASMTLSGVTFSMTMNSADVPGFSTRVTRSRNSLSQPALAIPPIIAPIAPPTIMPRNGHEEQHPEQQAPERPPRRSRARRAGGHVRVVLPVHVLLDHRELIELDHVVPLQPDDLVHRLLGRLLVRISDDHHLAHSAPSPLARPSGAPFRCRARCTGPFLLFPRVAPGLRGRRGEKRRETGEVLLRAHLVDGRGHRQDERASCARATAPGRSRPAARSKRRREGRLGRSLPSARHRGLEVGPTGSLGKREVAFFRRLGVRPRRGEVPRAVSTEPTPPSRCRGRAPSAPRSPPRRRR